MGSRFSLFLAELKRRKVVRVGVAYMIVGLGVIEGAQLLFTAFEIGNTAFQVVTFIVILGLPIALVMAWAFDVTPEGVQRTSTLPPDEAATARPSGPGTARWLAAALGLGIILVGGYFAFLRDQAPILSSHRVAILPLTNLTGNPDLDDLGAAAAYEITRGLEVAREVEVAPYLAVADALKRAGADATHEELAEWLQAGVLVAGAVTSEGGQLHFDVDLLDVATHEVGMPVEAWGSSEEDRLMEGVIDLRERVMGALGVDPDDVVARAMTQAAKYEAIQILRRAMEHFLDLDYEQAAPLFLEAFEADTTFFPPLIEALATNVNMRRYAAADSIAAFLEVRKERLGPIERHSLEGLSAGVRGDHEAAYRAAKESFSYDPTGRGYFYTMYCVQVGRIEEALEAAEFINYDLGFWREWPPVWWISSWANQLAGESQEGLRFAREGRQKFPEYLVLWRMEARALAALGRMGEFDSILDQIQTVAPGTPEHEGGTFSPGSVFRALSVDLSRMAHQERARHLAERSLDWFLNATDDAYRQELGEALLLAGRNEEAREYFRSLLEEASDSIPTHGAHGVALARTGDREGAEAEAAWLRDLDRPYLRGENTLWRARIMAQLSDTNSAVELIHQALSEGRLYYFLLSDFYFTPLWGHEPFEQLMAPRG